MRFAVLFVIGLFTLLPLSPPAQKKQHQVDAIHMHMITAQRRIKRMDDSIKVLVGVMQRKMDTVHEQTVILQQFATENTSGDIGAFAFKKSTRYRR